MNQDRLMQETVEDGSFFCFQGADFEVHPAKIIQTEVAFCKTEVKFAIYPVFSDVIISFGKTDNSLIYFMEKRTNLAKICCINGHAMPYY